MTTERCTTPPFLKERATPFLPLKQHLTGLGATSQGVTLKAVPDDKVELVGIDGHCKPSTAQPRTNNVTGLETSRISHSDRHKNVFAISRPRACCGGALHG